MKIHWIQHVPFEGLGNIQDWIDNNNHILSCTRQYLDEPLPKTSSIDMLIIMGGSMGVHDTEDYPWITSEIKFIKRCVKHNKPILGICLGAQFIATALGSNVYAGATKEIGWFPINVLNNNIFSAEESITNVFHWHGDTFDMPDDAYLMASTPEVKNQAYVIDSKKIVGLQFHLEQTSETIVDMLNNCTSEVMEGGFKVQSLTQINNNKEHFEQNKKMIFNILDYLVRK